MYRISDQEKHEQIGAAILLQQEQKIQLAHLKEKAERVRRAYQTFASQSDRWLVDPSRPDQVFLREPRAGENDLAAYLLSQTDLAALVAALRSAEEALRQTREKLAGFGVVEN